MEERNLGKGQDMYLLDPLDTWISIAQGSSARVLSGTILNSNGYKKTKAIKIMRQDRLKYALPLFLEEIIILQDMSEEHSIAEMYEYGVILLDQSKNFPKEKKDQTSGKYPDGRDLTGKFISIPPEETLDLSFIKQKASEGWLPYIALELKDAAENLYELSNVNITLGNYLNVPDAIEISYQICKILDKAHSKNIEYLDHKILHYYWDGEKVSIIDWNVSKKYEKGLTEDQKRFDIVQCGAQALYRLFTGGRKPEGALNLGPTRPEAIRSAPATYNVEWKFDDKRLPNSLKELLRAVLAGEYSNAQTLADEFEKLGK